MAGVTAKRAGRVPPMSTSIGLIAACIVGSGFTMVDPDTQAPAPLAEETSATVPILRQAHAAQGICYGWRLQDTYRVVSVGSNLGDGVAAAEDPRCPRWVEVAAAVHYTSQSSETEDSSSVRVRGSAGLDTVGIEVGIARFGLDADAFIDDPGWAICRAATVLPLLTAETGAAGAVPAASAAGAPPGALPDAGSDLWRDRWSHLFGAAGLLLAAAVFARVGWVRRRQQRLLAVVSGSRRAARPGSSAGAASAQERTRT